MIWWQYGIALALGTAIGGWFASRWSVGIPDKYIRVFLIGTVIALAIKLWFFNDWFNILVVNSPMWG